MDWSESTHNNLQHCFKAKAYKKWADAVGSKQLDKFSEDLDDLIDRLSSILITELKLHPNTHEKIVKIMDLAALAGKVL